MGGRACGNHAGKVARGNGFGRCAAEADFCGLISLGRRDPARAHGAILAADALGADRAGLHGCRTVEYRFNALLPGGIEHELGGFTDIRLQLLAFSFQP